MIELKGASGSNPDVWLVLEPIEKDSGTLGSDFADSLVTRFDQEVGIAKEFPGHAAGRRSCEVKADRASAIAYRDEFVATNQRFADLRPLDWAPGKRYPASTAKSASSTRSAMGTAAKPAAASALTIKATDTALPGLTPEQLARQREADAARTKAQVDARRNESVAEAKRKKVEEERRKRGNKQ